MEVDTPVLHPLFSPIPTRNRPGSGSDGLTHSLKAVWGVGVRLGEFGGEGVKAEMTPLAWIVVLVLHSLLSLVVMMCNCHSLPCPGPASSRESGPWLFSCKDGGTWLELTRGQLCKSHPGRPSRAAYLGATRSLGSWLEGLRIDLRECSGVFALDAPLLGESIQLLLGEENCLFELCKLLSLGERVGYTPQFWRVALVLWRQRLGKSTNSFVICPAASQPPFTLRFYFFSCAYFNSNSLNLADKSGLCWVQEYLYNGMLESGSTVWVVRIVSSLILLYRWLKERCLWIVWSSSTD